MRVYIDAKYVTHQLFKLDDCGDIKSITVANGQIFYTNVNGFSTSAWPYKPLTNMSGFDKPDELVVSTSKLWKHVGIVNGYDSDSPGFLSTELVIV